MFPGFLRHKRFTLLSEERLVVADPGKLVGTKIGWLSVMRWNLLKSFFFLIYAIYLSANIAQHSEGLYN